MLHLLSLLHCSIFRQRRKIALDPGFRRGDDLIKARHSGESRNPRTQWPLNFAPNACCLRGDGLNGKAKVKKIIKKILFYGPGRACCASALGLSMSVCPISQREAVNESPSRNRARRLLVRLDAEAPQPHPGPGVDGEKRKACKVPCGKIKRLVPEISPRILNSFPRVGSVFFHFHSQAGASLL